MFDLWIKACKENRTTICCFCGEGDTGVYSTWSEYEIKYNFYRTTPVYHVWIGGERVYCGMSYKAAMEVWGYHLRLYRGM